ncbi:hypothetical protein KO516_08455 [Citreicella sp. C3M06]|uniref:hypothetical protein n=1 Tax=Citreicella sp. C3M06 TaxID=2841564 RepID=UPI001C092992|nr:hypothetical protein [Citreicella sp. C3M06]MBU2960843.1 hypothetical protein [Citreicella sp. C3M06]
MTATIRAAEMKKARASCAGFFIAETAFAKRHRRSCGTSALSSSRDTIRADHKALRSGGFGLCATG